METDLGKKVVGFCDSHAYVDDHELRVACEEYDKAAIGYFAEPQTCEAKRFLGTWARLRRLWQDYSGESMFPSPFQIKE